MTTRKMTMARVITENKKYKELLEAKVSIGKVPKSSEDQECVSLSRAK
jgi:hypothetical protein